MNNLTEKQDSHLELDRWLGRREAFGLIAGRCRRWNRSRS
jgi:hypothetical protein